MKSPKTTCSSDRGKDREEGETTASGDPHRSTSPAEVERSAVQFSEAVRVRFVPTLDEFTDDEFRACFYCREEYKEMEDAIVRQLKRTRIEGAANDDAIGGGGGAGYCYRGLEKYMMTVNQNSRKRYVRLSRDAVLDEQDRQDELRYHCPDTIAMVYRNFSSSYQLWATALGLQDQREAQNCMDDDNMIVIKKETTKKARRNNNIRPLEVALAAVAASARSE